MSQAKTQSAKASYNLNSSVVSSLNNNNKTLNTNASLMLGTSGLDNDENSNNNWSNSNNNSSGLRPTSNTGEMNNKWSNQSSKSIDSWSNDHNHFINHSDQSSDNTMMFNSSHKKLDYV